MELEGNKRASRSRYVQSRTTPSRSTGSGLKQRLLVARFGPLSSRRGAAMLPVKPAIFPRRVRTSRERTARTPETFRTARAKRRCSKVPYRRYPTRKYLLDALSPAPFLFVYHRGGLKSKNYIASVIQTRWTSHAARSPERLAIV